MKLDIDQDYRELRAKAYPPIADQLDQIYNEGLDAWRANIAAIKRRFPKKPPLPPKAAAAKSAKE